MKCLPMKERTKEMVRLNCCVIGYWKIIVMYKHRSLFSDTHFYPLTLPTVQIWGASEKYHFCQDSASPYFWFKMAHNHNCCFKFPNNQFTSLAIKTKLKHKLKQARFTQTHLACESLTHLVYWGGHQIVEKQKTNKRSSRLLLVKISHY